MGTLLKVEHVDMIGELTMCVQLCSLHVVCVCSTFMPNCLGCEKVYYPVCMNTIEFLLFLVRLLLFSATWEQ